MKITKTALTLLIAGTIGGSSTAVTAFAADTADAADTEEIIYNMTGDVNSDNIVDARDASRTLSYYALTSTNQKTDLTAAEIYAADFNHDQNVDARDASAILSYYALESVSHAETKEVYPSKYKNVETGCISYNVYPVTAKTKYMMWMDLENEENHVFNGEFLKLTIKINENAPDREYALFYRTDFSDFMGQSVYTDCNYQGSLNIGLPAYNYPITGETGFYTYSEKIECSQGDTVDLYISLANNPGIAAACVWFDYDEEIMTIENITPVGEFAKLVPELSEQ